MSRTQIGPNITAQAYSIPPSNITGLPSGTAVWTNPTRVQTDDGSLTTSTGTAGTTTQALYCLSFNFDLASDEYVTGIEVQFGNKSVSGSAGDTAVYLIIQGFKVGGNKADFLDPTHAIYGGLSDTWGVSGLAPSVVNNNNAFGITYQALLGDAGPATMSIDDVKMTLYVDQWTNSAVLSGYNLNQVRLNVTTTGGGRLAGSATHTIVANSTNATAGVLANGVPTLSKVANVTIAVAGAQLAGASLSAVFIATTGGSIAGGDISQLLTFNIISSSGSLISGTSVVSVVIEVVINESGLVASGTASFGINFPNIQSSGGVICSGIVIEDHVRNVAGVIISGTAVVALIESAGSGKNITVQIIDSADDGFWAYPDEEGGGTDFSDVKVEWGII